MEQTDNGYSIKTQSTKGLSTFVLTLSISLLFSVHLLFHDNRNIHIDYDGVSVGVVTKKVRRRTSPNLLLRTQRVKSIRKALCLANWLAIRETPIPDRF